MDLPAQLFGSQAASSMPSIDPSQAQPKLAAKPQPYLLDVRQPEEHQSGHIPGASLIPLRELPRRMKNLPKDRETICVCRSGTRSHSAAQQLKAAGYNAVNLLGGMTLAPALRSGAGAGVGWSRYGVPVKKGSSKP